MKKKLREMNHPLCDRIIHQVDYTVRIERAIWRKNSKHKWNKLIEESKRYLEYGYDDWYSYHRASWVIGANFENLGDKDDLKLALGLAEESIKCHKEFMNLYIYAQLLNETGNRDKAVEIINESLEYINDRTENKYINNAKKYIREWTHENENFQ